MANDVYTGRDALVSISATPIGTVTDISMMVAELTIESTTDEVLYSTLGRERKVKLAGATEETWTIRGPYNNESDAFFRPLAAKEAGKNLKYEVEFAATSLLWTGECNILSFEATGINPENVEEFEATLGINTKTVAPVTVTGLVGGEADRTVRRGTRAPVTA